MQPAIKTNITNFGSDQKKKKKTATETDSNISETVLL